MCVCAWMEGTSICLAVCRLGSKGLDREDERVGGVDGNVWEEGLGQEREHGGGAWPFL